MTPIDDATLARHFRAISHPRRAKLFQLLARTPEVGLRFQRLQAATGLCDSSLVHHLREMERCGLVRRRREGLFVAYVIDPRGLAAAITEVLRLSSVAHPRPRAA